MGIQMKYFVLKPKGSNPYAAAARAAMRQYARLIKDTDFDLHAELMEWADREQFASLEAHKESFT